MFSHPGSFFVVANKEWVEEVKQQDLKHPLDRQGHKVSQLGPRHHMMSLHNPYVLNKLRLSGQLHEL